MFSLNYIHYIPRSNLLNVQYGYGKNFFEIYWVSKCIDWFPLFFYIFYTIFLTSLNYNSFFWWKFFILTKKLIVKKLRNYNIEPTLYVRVRGSIYLTVLSTFVSHPKDSYTYPQSICFGEREVITIATTSKHFESHCFHSAKPVINNYTKCQIIDFSSDC